jgi:ApaG protein
MGHRPRRRHQLVVEGDKIVGETPASPPGEQFSYNSYHVTGLQRPGPRQLPWPRRTGAENLCPHPAAFDMEIPAG